MAAFPVNERTQHDDREAQWTAAAQRGDLSAFNAIVERHQQAVYNLALSMLRDPASAEDAAQDAFIAAYRNIGRYRGGSLSAWLLTIVANRARDRMRSPAYRRAVSLDAIVEAGDPGGVWPTGEPGPADEAERGETVAAVRAAVAQLPDDQRLAVTLVDLQQLDYAEAAAVASVPVGTLKSRLSRGRERLRPLLRPYLELPGAPPRLTEGDTS